MTNKSIRKVAVLGSGIMGSRIALHLAGCGLNVLLLDRLHPDAINVNDKASRNKLVNDALHHAIQSKPSPLFHPSFADSITTGNFTDDMQYIAEADWIIEAVIELVEIKHQLFNQVEQYRKPGTYISTNTSGIPIQLMTTGRSDDFKKHFCGTHFFNPPRYLQLMEVIPTAMTNPEVVDFFMRFGNQILGKTTVLCKDTPAFIANRIGVFSMLTTMRIMQELKLSINDIDLLSGPIAGRPKSATFRTADVVGIDTLLRVADGILNNDSGDEQFKRTGIPEWLRIMVEKNILGDKTAGGFFRKKPNEKENKIYETLNIETFQYEKAVKTKFTSIDQIKNIEQCRQRISMLMADHDKPGQFHRAFHFSLFSYVSFQMPNIADHLYSIDDAMKAGFGWEIGVFETWDLLGVPDIVKQMQQNKIEVAPWVLEMIALGHHQFYKQESGVRFAYDIESKKHIPIPGSKAFLVMRDFENATVWKNNVCRAYHLGDDVLGLEWYTKMGSIGGDVLEGINSSISIAEKQFKGLVIANEGANFSAGANVGMVFMLAIEQDFDEIDMAIKMFQRTMMRLRYSSIPVAVAPHGLTLGGGTELCLHADVVVAAAETYAGLVEAGIGLIPGGGGTKENALRAYKDSHEKEPETITLQQRFINIATGKVATSAHEAFDLGVLRKGIDPISISQSKRIAIAKEKIVELYDRGYTMHVMNEKILVQGRLGMGAMLAGIHAMQQGNYATAHDAKVARKLAHVICGGDLSQPTFVNEQYLLDLEREAFLSLTGEKKTLERIQSVLQTGKPLRN
jgi:3-hydroxyacyl-CoA dehydrogenase